MDGLPLHIGSGRRDRPALRRRAGDPDAAAQFLENLKPASQIAARHTVGMLDAITALDQQDASGRMACRRRWKK